MRVHRNLLIPVGALLILTAASAMPCAGQQTGSLHVTVTDESGSVIPNANVDVVGLANCSGVSGLDGVVAIDGLPPGTYRIHVKARGVQDAELSGVVVVGGKRNDATIAMVISPPHVEVFETFDPNLGLKALEEAKEPGLCQQPLTEHMHRYRFLWVPTFDHPVFMRVDIQPDGTGTLRVRRWSGQGGYGWGKVQAGTTRDLSRDEQVDLLFTLADIGFWTLPARIEDDPTLLFLDATQWVIEGVRDGKCHVVTRYGSPLTGIVDEYFLGKVAKIKPYYKDNH